MKRNILSLTHKKAFTLAEVLITLGIIGIIAAITIPTMINDTQKNETVARVKETYSILSQAVSSIRADGVEMRPLFQTASSTPFYTLLIPKLKVMKDCGAATSGCVYNGTYRTLNNGAWETFTNPTYSAATLQNGVTMIVYPPSVMDCKWSVNGDKCTVITIDVNGTQMPNIMGKDVFQFWVTENSVLPLGAQGDPPLTNCSTSSSGNSCAARLLMEDAITYY